MPVLLIRLCSLFILPAAFAACLFYPTLIFSQDETSPPANNSEKTGAVFKPNLALGAGMLTFYGDITNNQPAHHAISSRLAYDLRVNQKVNSFLDASFYVMFGTLGANERSALRNINFESKITAGGFYVSYNFDHLLKQDRVIEPYVSVGLESFEFLSKTDRTDKSGIAYNYWSDGTIRSIREDAPNAKENAMRLKRDYTYESDIRTLNVDSFGKYNERSFAVPIGAGVNFLLTDRINFRLGTSLHYTFTDYIDGITDNSLGNRKGDGAKDLFLYSSFSLSYNLSDGSEEEEEEPEPVDPMYLAMLTEDSDNDSIYDFSDKCPNTPEGVPVDINGCPLDEDKDGVPDYKDQEPGTLAGMPVDSLGITLSDSLLSLLFAAYNANGNDTTGSPESKRVEHLPDGSGSISGSGISVPKNFMVQVGAFSGGIPPELANQLLSIPDVRSWEENNLTIITVGNYEKLPDAVKRQLELLKQGIPAADVVTKGKEGRIEKVKIDDSDQPVASSGINDAEGEIVYRVQVGAFTRKISKNTFESVPEMLVVPFEDGLTRYYSGIFNSYEDAAKRKVDLTTEGFDGAFVVAFKNGKRLALGEKGAIVPKEEGSKQEKVIDESDMSKDKERTSVNKSLVKFKVQAGLFKNLLPNDVLEKFTKIGDIKPEAAPGGHTRYTTGLFSDYASAVAHKDNIVKTGLVGAFVVGEFKGKIIPAQEAVELLK